MSKDLLKELFSFISHDNAEVRKMALNHILSLSVSEEFLDFIKNANTAPLKERCMDEFAEIANDAVKIMINLSSKMQSCTEIERQIVEDFKFIKVVCALILTPTNILADLACVLLSNLSTSSKCCEFLVSQPVLMIQLLAAFSDGQKLNKKVNFDFLSNVFSNITANTLSGKEFFMSEKYDYPLKLVLPDTLNPSSMRKIGSVLTIKNCLTLKNCHNVIIMEKIPFLVQVLLPLAGPEDFSDEDMNGMPQELQFLEADKKREKAPNLRLDLIDSLILLAQTREGRDYMRRRKVYPIIRELHLAETNKDCMEAIERLVNLLMREEEKVTEVEDALVGH